MVKEVTGTEHLAFRKSHKNNFQSQEEKDLKIKRNYRRTDLYCLHRKNTILPRIENFQDGCWSAEADFMPFHLTVTADKRQKKFHI